MVTLLFLTKNNRFDRKKGEGVVDYWNRLLKKSRIVIED